MPKTISQHAQKPRYISADDRSRLALGKAGVSAYEDFFVTVFDTGHIVLTPATMIPKNEMPLWNDGEFIDSLTRGINQAVSGRTKSLNHLIPNSKPTKARKRWPSLNERADLKRKFDMSVFKILWTNQAEEQFLVLQHQGPSSKLTKVSKTLEILATHGPKYRSLHSHKYQSIKGPNGEDVWESYVEIKTSSAWRIWWMYGPTADVITLIMIGKHP